MPAWLPRVIVASGHTWTHRWALRALRGGWAIASDSREVSRIRTDGKFLAVGAGSFRVRGVTYGGFKTRLDGWQYPDSSRLKQDFTAIAGAGLNTIRTYTLPPPEAMEIAAELDLRFLIGLNYHDWRMEFDTGRSGRRRILEAGRRSVAEAMDALVGNPAVLAVAVGNEIPVDLVRLHGSGAVADTLSDLVLQVHDADPDMLATYVNFPTTEFLEIDGGHRDVQRLPGAAGPAPARSCRATGRSWSRSSVGGGSRCRRTGRVLGLAATNRRRGRVRRSDRVLLDG